VSCGDRGDRIHEVLTPAFLDRLVQRKGICILYTHLGKLKGRGLEAPAVKAFRLVAEYYKSRKILVTSTRRLLDCLIENQAKVVDSWSRLELPSI
jgi:hypothetical protein